MSFNYSPSQFLITIRTLSIVYIYIHWYLYIERPISLWELCIYEYIHPFFQISWHTCLFLMLKLSQFQTQFSLLYYCVGVTFPQPFEWCSLRRDDRVQRPLCLWHFSTLHVCIPSLYSEIVSSIKFVLLFISTVRQTNSYTSKTNHHSPLTNHLTVRSINVSLLFHDDRVDEIVGWNCKSVIVK